MKNLSEMSTKKYQTVIAILLGVVLGLSGIVAHQELKLRRLNSDYLDYINRDIEFNAKMAAETLFEPGDRNVPKP